MLAIHIESIGDHALHLDQNINSSDLPMLAALSRESKIVLCHPVRVHIRATMVDARVLIEGKVETIAKLLCSRCLAPYELAIESEFSVTASPETCAAPDQHEREEVELSAEEIDTFLYTGNRIDLDDEVAQQIIMALPIKPLCKKACKGLCNRCGADLNHGTCGCEKEKANNPFDVLKKLSFPDRKK
jgi:uncharacterized protein